MSEVKKTPATGTPAPGSADIPAAVPISVTGPPKKAPPSNLVVPPKKPKLSKAERRALQEQQRAAKSGERVNNAAVQSPSTAPLPSNNKVPAIKVEQKHQQQNTSQQTLTSGSTTAEKEAHTKAEETIANQKKSKGISLLSHLPPYRDPYEHSELFFGVRLGGKPSPSSPKLHPAVLETGRAYAMGSILGSNARCRAMLNALQRAISDYSPPPDGDIRNHVTNQVLKPSFTYWTQECRPHSVSMGNAVTFVKSAVVAALDRDMSWSDCQTVLLESIEAYIQERIDYADLAIAAVACDKISNGDVILTYAHSEAIRVVLQEAHARKTKFRVIVVDSKPLLEGKVMLRELRESGLECTYILLNALSYVMKDVTKIMLGAKALLNDGSVYGRVGTACVALSAKDVPVLVCAETYKISTRVQLEAITNNEQGNPQRVVEGELGDNLRVINLLFDLTPASFISGIITEMGILPPTSVAVLLREMNPQDTHNVF